MIYRLPGPEESVDQGDVIDSCPISLVSQFVAATLEMREVETSLVRGVVLTQTCDLANRKVSTVMVAVVVEAQRLVNEHVLKPAEIRGPIRGGRVFGLYFLPKCEELGLPESIVDLRQVHTLRLDCLVELCRNGRRRGRIQPLYREHLAKHFADSYSRIGLPEPYATD